MTDMTEEMRPVPDYSKDEDLPLEPPGPNLDLHPLSVSVDGRVVEYPAS